MPARLITTLYLSIAVLTGFMKLAHFPVSSHVPVRNCAAYPNAAALRIECNIVSDISQAVDNIRESAASIKRFADSLSQFFETVGAVFSFIGSLLGAKALLLLAGVMVSSALLSTLGVPRGKFSFFVSLGFADFIWAAWRKSFEGIDSSFVVEMVKANLILLAPFLIIYFSKRYYPYLTQKSIQVYAWIRRKKTGIAVEEALAFWESYKAVQNDFERALMDDIVAGDKGKVTITDDTKRFASEMQHLLERIAQEAPCSKKNKSV